MKQILTAITIAVFSVAAWSESAILKKDYPSRYVVKKGDTLWDISGKFLKKPSRWREIWTKNKQIKNPHRIYPGDVLRLIFVNGKPQIVINGKAPGESTAVARNLKGTAIPMVRLGLINEFLTGNRVIPKEVAETSPYVLTVEAKRVIAGKGDKVYARGNFTGAKRFSVYRSNRKIIDPETGALLGIESTHVGDAVVTKTKGDVAQLLITSTTGHMKKDDFLLPQRRAMDMSGYFPSRPKSNITGQIAALKDSASLAARWQVVVVNRGYSHGLKPGNVLTAWKQDRVISDKRQLDRVALPSDVAGEVLVFKVYERMSYALVMRSGDTLRVNDMVGTPK
ncbi:MAG: LysM peptidoglycan-binding domain-containing protein [Pseudomonadota bacterium]